MSCSRRFSSTRHISSDGRGRTARSRRRARSRVGIGTRVRMVFGVAPGLALARKNRPRFPEADPIRRAVYI
jgi:hypothetical protein